jgi:predicted TIM-barrel fold metal-dependent hydrolase
MKEAHVHWAFTVAMGTSGGYDVTRYAHEVKIHYPGLFPIAFWDFKAILASVPLVNQLRQLQKMGYIGIKIHPRLARIDYLNPHMADIIKAANDIELLVLLCTYPFSKPSTSLRLFPNQLYRLLNQVHDQKLILLHGGGVYLLEVMEMTRHFKNTLLDLSWTLSEYENSSLDFDLRFVFEHCHHRICIGSDSPEKSMQTMRRRFEALSNGLEIYKRENIAYHNLMMFTGLAHHEDSASR